MRFTILKMFPTYFLVIFLSYLFTNFFPWNFYHKGQAMRLPKNKDVQRVGIENPVCIRNNQKFLGELQEQGNVFVVGLSVMWEQSSFLREVPNSASYSRYVAPRRR